MFLLILLLLALLDLTSLSPRHSSGRGTATVAPPMRLGFTINGKSIDARREVPPLRPGQVLHFVFPIRTFSLVRLECRNVVHTIRLEPRRRWRVPDLAEGAYSIKGRGATFNFNYLVHVRNHAAPCPGP